MILIVKNCHSEGQTMNEEDKYRELAEQYLDMLLETFNEFVTGFNKVKIEAPLTDIIFNALSWFIGTILPRLTHSMRAKDSQLPLTHDENLMEGSRILKELITHLIDLHTNYETILKLYEKSLKKQEKLN
jgi:hypothetical protein